MSYISKIYCNSVRYLLRYSNKEVDYMEVLIMKAWAFILRDRKVNRDIAKSDNMETIIKKAKRYSFDKCGNPIQDKEPFIMMLSADGHHYSEIEVFTGKEY